jgi:amino acid transporter/nucleotide-binding universal stress UspA family protein
MDWLAHAVAGSLYAVIFGAYVVWGAQTIMGWGEPPTGAGEGEGMGTLFGVPAWPIAKGLTLAVCVLFLWINHRGSRETGKAGNIITVSKIIIIAIFIAAGLFAMVQGGEAVVGEKFTPFLPEGFSGVLIAMGLTFIAFEGYEIIVQAGEEVVEPRKNIPKAVFLSLLIVIPIYILVAVVCLGALVIPADVMATTGWKSGETWRYLAGLGETGVAVAANAFLPWGLGGILLVIGAVLSTMSALNATTFSSTRVSFAMGRDRFLPAALSHVSPRTRTPTIALAASGVLIVSVALLLDAEMVAGATCAMFLLVFAMVNIASIVIRRKYGDKLQYGYLVPGGPVIPIIAAIGQVGLAIWLLASQPMTLWLTSGWIVVGIAIYYSWSRSQEHAFRASPVIYEQTPHVLTSTHQVLVPVANPATAGSLVELAARLTDPSDTAVTVLNVVKVPEQLPFESTEPFVKEGRVVVEKAMGFAETTGREVAGLVRVSRHAGQAIVETVTERHIDTLVMGWTGPKRSPRRVRSIVIGEQIDTVIRRADCDTVILRGSVPSKPRRIVVPVAHPGQGSFALGLAARLAGPSTIIEAVRVVTDPDERDAAEKRLRVDLFGEDGSPDLPGVEWPVELTIVVADDITEALVEAGSRADILILGATMGGWRGSMFSPIHYGVAERWQGPLLLVRMRSGAAKFAAHRTIDFLVSTEPEA